jgi:hypothetical protein
VQQPCLDGVQAQAFALLPQAPNLFVQHADPAQCERGI